MSGGPRLICVGNLTVDDTITAEGGKRDACLGGDALYATLAARLYQSEAEMLAPIGSDAPDSVVQTLADHGLRPEHLPRRAAPTIRNRVEYESSGSREWTLLTDPADFDTLSVRPGDVPPEWSTAPAFLVCAMSLAAQSELTEWLAEQTDATIYLDLQEDYIRGHEEQVMRMVANADVFLPSEQEVENLLGHRDWPRGARELASAGPDAVVIKRSGEGSLVLDSATDTVTNVPASPARVVDSTGAGDAFCGAFAAVHQLEGDLVVAARAGSAAAATAIADYGTAALLAADARRRNSQ